MASARIIPIIINVQPGGGGVAVVTQIASAFKQLDQEADRAGTHGLRSAENGMTSAFVAAELLNEGLHKVFDFIKEAIVDTTLFAGRTEELTIALHQLAAANNISTDSIDAQLKGLINLNIARQEATQILAQMVGANLDLSKAEGLATVARDAAVISRKNTSEEFQLLTQAILEGRTEAFRAAGVYLSVEDALQKGTKALGLNKEGLDEQKRTQILTNAVIEYGTRLTGTYEAAMGSASKQMRSLVRVHDDAKESIGALFQGPFMVGVQVTGELLKLIAAYPATFVLATVAILAFGAAMVFANTSAIPGMISGTLQLISSVKLLGQVMIGTASLVQGAAATSLAFTAGWAAVAIAVIAVAVAVVNMDGAIEHANKITIEQVQTQSEALKSSMALGAAAKEVALAQEGSADRHQKLNAVLGQLDPATKAYILALVNEKDQVVALNEKISQTIELKRSTSEATLFTAASGILGLRAEIEATNKETLGWQETIRQTREQIKGLNAADMGHEEDLDDMNRLITELSSSIVDNDNKIGEWNKQLGQNDVKLMTAAIALGLNRDQLLNLATTSGFTADQIKVLGQEYDSLTPKLNTTTNAVNQQATALQNLKNVQDSFKVRDTAIEAGTINIIRDAKNAGEAVRQLREARQKDPALNQSIIDKQRTDANKKAIDAVISPSAGGGGGHGSRPVDEIKEMTRAVEKLQQQVTALKAGGGKLFDLEIQKSDLEATKREYEEIFKLRHQLQQDVGAPVSEKQDARQAELRDLQRHLSTKQEIIKIDEQGLDNAEKAKVLAHQISEANLIAAGADAKHAATMQGLIDLKSKELDISVQVTDAEAETQAIRQWLIAHEAGKPVLGGNKNGSAEYAQSIEEQAKLFDNATANFSKNAVVAHDQEIARQKALTAQYYGESSLRDRIIKEEATARIKADNDASEEIKRIEERLSHALISNDLALELARARAAEQRRKDVQSIGIDVQLVIDQLARLAGGDKQETSIASDSYLKSFYSSMVGVRQELVAIKGLGGVNAIFGSAEFQQSLKEKFDLGQLHTVIDLGTQIEQSQYNVAHAAETSALRYRLAWQKAYEDVATASQRALEARAVDEVKLAHQMDVDVNRIDDGLVHFLAEQKTLQQTFQDVRTNTVKSFFDGIDSAIDKVIKKGSLLSNTLGQLLKDLIHLFASQYLQRLLGIGTGAGAGAGANLFTGSTGGSPALGGGASGSGSNSSVGANLLNNFLSGSRAPSFSSGVPAGIFSAGALGGGISAPASLSAQTGSLSALHELGNAGLGGAAAGASSSAGLNLGALGSGLGAMAPLLGVGLGAQLGGNSRLGQILGATGGLLAGGIIGALTGTGIFAGGGIAGAGGALAFLPALLTNPITLIAAPLIILGAILLAKRAQRNADEKVRNQSSTDTLGAIYQLLGAAQHGDVTLPEAVAQFEQIHQQYLSSISGIKDSKTKRNALLWWDYVAGTAVDPGGKTGAIWPQIAAAAKAGEAAKAFSSTFVPTFATGGLVPYRGGMMTMIKVRPDELMVHPGGFAEVVPGVDRGYDSVLTMAQPGTRVLTKAQQRGSNIQRLLARSQGFLDGGTLGGGSASSASTGAQTETIVFEPTNDVAAALLELIFKGMKMPAGKRVIVDASRANVNNEGMAGLLGDIVQGIQKRQ